MGCMGVLERRSWAAISWVRRARVVRSLPRHMRVSVASAASSLTGVEASRAGTLLRGVLALLVGGRSDDGVAGATGAGAPDVAGAGAAGANGVVVTPAAASALLARAAACWRLLEVELSGLVGVALLPRSGIVKAWRKLQRWPYGQSPVAMKVLQRAVL